MNKKELEKKAANGVAWRTAEMFLTQAVQFVVTIILARILTPDDYGITAIITVFINFATTLMTSGFSTALIQRKDLSQTEIDAVFTITILITTVLACVLFFAAGAISTFYKLPAMVNPLRVLTLTLYFDAFISIQQSMLSRNLRFKSLFFRGVCSTSFSGFVGIIMALRGYGVWALIGQQVSYKVILEIILFVTVSWRPRFTSKLASAVEIIKFGWKMLAANFANTVYQNLRSLIIGRKYSAEDLGIYNKGKNFPSMIVYGINSAISTTMLPIYSKAQSNTSDVKELLRKSLSISAYIIIPMTMGMAAVAEPMVRLLLTEKWISCVPYVIIACMMYALEPMTTANLQAFGAIGRSDMYLKIMTIRQIVSICILLLSVPFGVKAIAFSGVLDATFALCINTIPNRKLLQYNVWEYAHDFLPGIIEGAVVYFSASLALQIRRKSDVVSLVAAIIIGILAYLITSIVTNNKVYREILSILSLRISGRRSKK